MPTTLKSISAIGFAIILGACAQQEEGPRAVYSEPVFNKLGDVTGCRSADGTITDVSQTTAGTPNSQRNPCLPPPPDDCDNGYTSAGQPCRQPGDNGDGRQPGGNPTGGQTGSPTTGPIP